MSRAPTALGVIWKGTPILWKERRERSVAYVPSTVVQIPTKGSRGNLINMSASLRCVAVVAVIDILIAVLQYARVQQLLST